MCYVLQTSFLQVILRELNVLATRFRSVGEISYASQDPWIFSGTIRQNILFGMPFEKQLYNSVVRISCLNDDFERFPHGDLTLVGDRGITLSGGQKARVNLARALYHGGDIFLLDDPLSSVDVRVANDIFRNCIQNHLEGKLRILVTHQVQYLQYADFIIVLDKVW